MTEVKDRDVLVARLESLLEQVRDLREQLVEEPFTEFGKTLVRARIYKLVSEIGTLENELEDCEES